MYRIIACLLLLPVVSLAQSGGRKSFDYVNIPSNTVLTALGGVNVSLANADVNLAFSNPALNGDTLSGMASFNYTSYPADAGVFSGVYQHNFGKSGSWFAGITHINYGEFESYDATGELIGNYSAGETQLIIGRSHRIRNFTVGGSIKLFSSQIAQFGATAIAADMGGLFSHPEKQFTIGMTIKNIGVVVSDYTDLEGSELPFDVQVGMTVKPEHMPFRFSLTGYNLASTDLTYYESTGEEAGTFDKTLSHVNIGAELLLSKNINLRFGYNHLRRQELKLEEAGGGAGFSYGLMFKVKSFEFSYSRGGYHAAGGSNTFGLTVNTNRFYKKLS